MFGLNWILVPSTTGGLNTHAIWKRKDTPACDHGPEYLDAIAANKSALIELCIEYACNQLREGVGFTTVKSFIPHSSIQQVIFYHEFVDALVNPERMDTTEGIILKQNILSAMTAYNEEIAAYKRYPSFPGRPGFLTAAWNEEKKQFEYPTVEQLLSRPWIIPLDYVAPILEDIAPSPGTPIPA
jgi:hypothetical protein